MRLTRTRSELRNDGAPEAADQSSPTREVDAIDELIHGELAGNTPAPPAADAQPQSTQPESTQARSTQPQDAETPSASEGDTILPDQLDAPAPLPVASPVPAPPAAVVTPAPPMQAAPAPPVPAPPVPAATEPAPEGRRARNARQKAAAKAPAPEAPAAAPVAAQPEAADAADAESVPRRSGRPLGELLVGRGLVSEEQLSEALLKQTASGKRLGNLLVELDLLGERALTDVLAEQLGLTVVDLSRTEIDPTVVELLPEEDACRLGALPTHRDGTRIEVAVADPLVENLDAQLIEILGSLVRIKLAVRSDLDQAIERSYAPSADLGDALRMFEARLEARKASQAPDTVVQTVVDENAPIVKIVNVILEQAVHDRASDVHIEPMADSVRVRVRTDGALHQITTLPGTDGPVARESHQGHVRHEHRRAPAPARRPDGGDDR